MFRIFLIANGTTDLRPDRLGKSTTFWVSIPFDIDPEFLEFSFGWLTFTWNLSQNITLRMIPVLNVLELFVDYKIPFQEKKQD